MATKKTLANIKSPIIQAVINEQYRFKTEEDALKKIAYLKTRFVESKKAREADGGKNAIIWVKDYDLTDEETEAGLLGNFALINFTFDKKSKQHYLQATKLPAEPKFHPKRIRSKQSTADFGHFVLRRVSKNWWYPTIEEANKDLELLAADYPEVSIPATNKLYTMIYRRAEKGDKPVKRYVLEVEAHEQGGFTISIKENTYVAKKKPEKKTHPLQERMAAAADATAATAEGTPPTDGTTQGKFTSLVALKRSRKKK